MFQKNANLLSKFIDGLSQETYNQYCAKGASLYTYLVLVFDSYSNTLWITLIVFDTTILALHDQTPISK